MAGSARYTAVLDACVLYPLSVRDLLLSLACQGLYHARWSADIQDEWVRNLLNNRPDLRREQLNETVRLMEKAIPDAVVTGYEAFINAITLPDPNDRHVVAAALVGHADAIVTFNLRDFPMESLRDLEIEVQHPDDFVVNQLNLDLANSLKAVKAMRLRSKKPPHTAEQLIEIFERRGLPQTASMLSDNVELL
jgi:predicted nucleic acid-binding protein